MIKATLTNGDLVFGLSKENLIRLEKGEPIVFNLKEMGLEDRRVMITFGETEDSLYKDMMEFIDINKTKIHFESKNDGHK